MSADDKTITIKIKSTRGTQEFTFEKQTKISEVIEEAVRVFGFAPGDRFELVLESNPGEPLRPERTLVSYHITDGTILVLTSIGSGV